MSGPSVITIRDFVLGDLAKVRELFASGLMEFAGEAEEGVRRYVDHALEDDMADIPAHYQSGPRSNFWVAESDSPSAGVVGIVGIVGIQPRELEEEAELRRMSVSSAVRRQGVGRQLLDTTEEFCRSKGYLRIGLSTVDILKPALLMYQNYGYILEKAEPYGPPSRSQVTVHHFIKDLY